MKTAIVCDWLMGVGGAEQVLLAIHKLYPDAPIYTSQYRPGRATWFADADVRTGWLNVLPAGLKRFMPFLRNWYFGHLDLTEYDLVISVVNAEAKGVRTRPDAVHVAYLQGPPTQYYWGLYDEYIKNPGFGKLNFLARLGLKILVRPLRKIDYKFAQKPDYLLANSNYTASEIKKYYHRDAVAISPNVDVDLVKKTVAKLGNTKRSGFVISGRQVSWKRIDLAIKACLELNEKLLVIGYGPEHQKLVKLAAGHDNISFLPRYDGPADIARHLRVARAFIFPSVEPFGIAPIEALAAGTPVIALKKGGALDFMNDQNGIFFEHQTCPSLTAALQSSSRQKFDQKIVAKSVEKFSVENFNKNFQNFIKSVQK